MHNDPRPRHRSLRLPARHIQIRLPRRGNLWFEFR